MTALGQQPRESDGTGRNDSAWGHDGRHYAVSAGGLARQARSPSALKASSWAEALQRASPGIRESVERAYKQWNTILRDLLRSETALRLTAGGETQAVPVRIVDGMPAPFAEVIGEFDGLEWLLLNRPAIVKASEGAAFMGQHLDAVRRALGHDSGTADHNDLSRVHETATAWLRRLDELKAVQRIVGIDQDVLGAYFFRIPEVRLYWVVIGITARILGVTADALTIVVLAHELAHAYTHLGRDIDNERWDTELFAASDLRIVEGLAQFYAQVVCRKLEYRMPAALNAFNSLLEKQTVTYQTHRQWVEDDERGGEIVRVTMIECRSKGITDSDQFAETIMRHRAGIRGARGGHP